MKKKIFLWLIIMLVVAPFFAALLLGAIWVVSDSLVGQKAISTLPPPPFKETFFEAFYAMARSLVVILVICFLGPFLVNRKWTPRRIWKEILAAEQGEATVK